MAIFSNFKKIRPALCLGGGGARGYAHIGAIKALEEAGLSFDLVAGTSVGSLIGGFYAAGLTGAEMEQLGESINLKDVHSGFTPNDPLKIGAIIKNNLGNIRIEDLKRNLYIVAVDLVEAVQVIIDRGLLYEAVSASCAVPVFFRPLIKGSMHLVDGGLLNNIPADVCRMMGATHVITVDINPTRGSGTDGLGVMDVAKGTFGIMTAAASQTGIINSDIIIAPDLSRFKATKKDGHDEMIRLGYEAAKEKIPAIKNLLGIKTVFADKQEKRAAKIEKKAAKKQRTASIFDFLHSKGGVTTEIPEDANGSGTITYKQEVKRLKERQREEKRQKKEEKKKKPSINQD